MKTQHQVREVVLPLLGERVLTERKLRAPVREFAPGRGDEFGVNAAGDRALEESGRAVAENRVHAPGVIAQQVGETPLDRQPIPAVDVLERAVLIGQGPSGPIIVGGGARPLVVQSGVELAPHTLSEAVNVQKLGNGQAQFVIRPPATGEPVELPTSMFSLAMRVALAPSSRLIGLVWMSQG